jgi:hypothetical protein
MKISIYAPYTKERFETAREHSILHPERIVGNPEVIPRNVGEEQALPPQSNSVKTFVMARLAWIIHEARDLSRGAGIGRVFPGA